MFWFVLFLIFDLIPFKTFNYLKYIYSYQLNLNSSFKLLKLPQGSLLFPGLNFRYELIQWLLSALGAPTCASWCPSLWRGTLSLLIWV